MWKGPRGFPEHSRWPWHPVASVSGRNSVSHVPKTHSTTSVPLGEDSRSTPSPLSVSLCYGSCTRRWRTGSYCVRVSRAAGWDWSWDMGSWLRDSSLGRGPLCWRVHTVRTDKAQGSLSIRAYWLSHCIPLNKHWWAAFKQGAGPRWVGGKVGMGHKD